MTVDYRPVLPFDLFEIAFNPKITQKKSNTY